MNRYDAVEEYYAAIDAGDYGRLRDLLAPGFVHRRPDRTLDGPERFVRFMREERPRTDTEHVVERVAVTSDPTTDSDAGATAFAQGRLLTLDGDELFGFVDVHRIAEGRIESLRTYTD
jgi:ketosteroid isomerase-like protein